MECSCVHGSLDWDFDEEPRRRRTTSKRNWRCGECRKVLKAGEEHIIHSSCCDGKRTHYRVCKDCQSVIDNLFCDWYVGQIWDDLAYHIDECEGDISQSAISKLTPLAKASVCDLIEKAWR